MFDSATGQHVEGWVQTHGSSLVSGHATCTECHGEQLEGGISKVGCFQTSFQGTSCHGAAVFHGSTWPDPDVHGAAAKGAPDTMTGFASCQLCHGQDFAGGVVLTACSACHGIPAPHPEPWKLGTRTHVNTDPANVPVCGLCHDRDPSFNSSPAPPGTAFGCFNSTLCHGSVDPHPADWADPDVHGAAAKG
ncbi:MAG: hypothetical protein P8Y39_11815, partial [Nitrospirota bacterium]